MEITEAIKRIEAAHRKQYGPYETAFDHELEEIVSFTTAVEFTLDTLGITQVNDEFVTQAIAYIVGSDEPDEE